MRHSVLIEIERSNTEPAFIAEMRPRITASGTVMTAVIAANRAVFHKRSPISSEISRPLPREVPRSPVRRPRNQSQ